MGLGWGCGAHPIAGPIAACPQQLCGGAGGSQPRSPGSRVPAVPLSPQFLCHPGQPSAVPSLQGCPRAASVLPSPLRAKQGCAKRSRSSRKSCSGLRNKGWGGDVAPAACRDGRSAQHNGAAGSCHAQVCGAGCRRQGFGNQHVVNSIQAPWDAQLLLTRCLLPPHRVLASVMSNGV